MKGVVPGWLDVMMMSLCCAWVPLLVGEEFDPLPHPEKTINSPIANPL